MSHPMYNPHGGPFPSGQRTVVTGQYVLGSQSGLDFGAGPRLGPDPLPSSRGRMMVNQPMALGRPMGQHPATVPLDLDATIAMNIRGAREEVRLRTQMMQQAKPVDPIYKNRDAAFPPTGGGLAANSIPGRSANVDWGNFKAPSKLFAPSGDGHSFSSSQHFKPSGFGGGGEQSSLDSQPSSEYQSARYTPESANSILAKFGLSSDDLELLSLYPDDQLTPDNLPYILRDIRMRKSKRNDDRLPTESQQGKVIDYGHSSKFGFSEEKADSRPKESSKFGMDIATSSVSNIDKTKRPLQPPSAAVHTQPPVMVPKLHPSVMAPRPSSQNLSNQSVKSIMERLPTTTPVQHMSRSPLVPPAFASSLAPMNSTSSGGQFPFSSQLLSTSTPAVTKRLPTPTMMNDYSAATPRIFPHTCSLCNIECAKLKDWIEHQNTSRHIESCRRLRKQYPDWKADSIPVTRTEEERSPKRRTRSHSYSRSPSPKRHHGSSSHRHRSRSRTRSRSRSPRRSNRRTRSRSRSWSPPRRSRGSPTYRRRSRTPPRKRSRSPDYSSSRRARRASPRRNSPLLSQRSSSSERLAKKLLDSSELSSVSDSNSLKAMVQSLAPALLAELAKKRNSSASSSAKGGSSRKRSTSPPSKRSESSKASSSSATKDVRPKNPGAPGTSCLLRFKKVPFGTTQEELVEAILPFGKIYTAILLRKMEEASVCMMREEDAKALSNCKDLKLRGQTISISLEKDATQSSKHSEHQSKPETKRKEPKPAAEKQSSKMSQASRYKESPKASQPAKPKVVAKTPQTAKERQMAKTKVLKPTPGETQVKRVVRKEIPWRKNIVEITDLPEDVAEDDIAKLGAPHGCISKPVIAVTQHKAYLQMPSAEAAEALVKAYSKSSVKIQNKKINITMMTRPIDLKYTESIFRALMGMDKLSPSEKASLPERLLSVSNIPTGSKAITDVQNLVKRFGFFKQCLPLNGRIIFEMDSPALARTVCSRFIKVPCIIQNNTLSFKLIKVPKSTEQMKKKLDSSGPKPNLKSGCKAPETTKPSEPKSAPAKLAATPTLTSGAADVAAKVDSDSDLNKGVKNSSNELKVDTSNEKAAATSAPDGDQTDASDTTLVKSDHEKDLVFKTEQNTVVDAEQPILEDHGLPKVSTEKEVVTEHAKEKPMDTSEQVERLQIDPVKEASVKGVDQERRSPVEAVGPAEGLPIKVEVPAIELSVKMEELAEGLPVKVEGLAENLPIKAEEPTEELLVKVEEPAEELPVEAKTSPVEIEEPAKSLPAETIVHFETELLGNDESSPIKNEKSDEDRMEHDGKLETEMMPDKPSEQDKNLSLDKYDEAQLQQISETKPTVPSDAEDVSSKPQEEEHQNESVDTSAPGTEEAKQNELKPQGTEQPSEVLMQDETVQNDGTLQSSPKHQVTKTVEMLPQGIPSGEMQTDIPPVTPEILKALEAAVHQCRLQSSIRRAEEARTQTVTVAKDTEKATSSSKKSSTSDMEKKRESRSGARRSEDKDKNSQNSGSRSKHDSIEKESSSRHRSMASPDNGTSNRRGSSVSSTGSRRSMADSSPVSRRKECDESGIKSHSTSRQTRSSRSDPKAKPKEKVEEDFMELFPFNLDEFVTVDEVVDETVEATPPENAKSRARGSKVHHTGSTTKKKGGRDSGSMKKASTPATKRQTRSSLKAQDTTVEEEHVAAKPITDVKETKKLKKSQVSEGDPNSTECQSEAVSTEITDSEEITNNDPSTFDPTTQLDASVLSKQPIIPSEVLESKIPLDDQDHEPHSDTLHSESLMTLDEVADYEDEVNDADIEDEQLVEALKDLVTLDEIVAEEDECDTLVSMEEMLGGEEMNEGEQKESSHCSQENESATQPDVPASLEDPDELCKNFVTVDEVGEEEEEKQEVEEIPTTKRGRKPKRRARQKAQPKAEEEKSSSSTQEPEVTPQETNTDAKPPAKKRAAVKEEEKGSSSTQEPEVTPQETNTDAKSPAKKRAAVEEEEKNSSSTQEPEVTPQETNTDAKPPAKKRAAVKVRVSNRQKAISSTQLEEDSGPGTTDKDNEQDSKVSKVQEISDLPNIDIHSSTTEEEKSSSITQEPEVTVQETNTDAKSPAKKRAAVKGKSKLRGKAQPDQEPESKRPCTEPLVPEDFTLPPFNPDNPIGIDFIVPKTGYFCKLCSLFYGNEVTAKRTHCSSFRHYENMQKYYEKQKSEPSARSPSAHSSTD